MCKNCWRSTKRIVKHCVIEPIGHFVCDCDGSPQCGLSTVCLWLWQLSSVWTEHCLFVIVTALLSVEWALFVCDCDSSPQCGLSTVCLWLWRLSSVWSEHCLFVILMALLSVEWALFVCDCDGSPQCGVSTVCLWLWWLSSVWSEHCLFVIVMALLSVDWALFVVTVTALLSVYHWRLSTVFSEDVQCLLYSATATKSKMDMSKLKNKVIQANLAGANVKRPYHRQL